MDRFDRKNPRETWSSDLSMRAELDINRFNYNSYIFILTTTIPNVFSALKELCQEMYQSSNSGNRHQIEWTFKLLLKTWKEGINNTLACTKEGTDSPSVRKSKTVLDPGFYAMDSGFQVLVSSLCQWNPDSGFQSLVGFRIHWGVVGFQSPGLQISQVKFSGIPESGFLCVRRHWWSKI